MSALPGAGWAEPKCCVVCDREDCEDAAHSGVAPAKEKDAPPPDGVERLCAPRSSLSDDRTYRVVRLANGITVALVRDEATDKAAAALCAGIGAYSDTDAAGLAHFLEHMLFQGTKTYPEDNAYKQYVARHGGSTNASTSGERTTFQFDVVDAAFEGALDRFGRFFVEPLLLETCVEREMHAVDAEHSKNLNDDGRRAYQVLRESANSAHPFKNFSTGCLETLKLPDVRDRLLRLWKDRYDPASMTACLVAARPLADLENLAVEAFGGIRRDADASPGPFEEEKMAREPLFSRTGIIHERVPAQRPSGIVFNNRWNAGAVESQGA